jgi:transposase
MENPHRLTDAQWNRIAPLLPPAARTGRPRADDRRTLDAILYVLYTGCRWNDLPREYGASSTAFRRLTQWQAGGVWERIRQTLLSTLDEHGKLDWQRGVIDGSFVRAKRGAPPSASAEKARARPGW